MTTGNGAGQGGGTPSCFHLSLSLRLASPSEVHILSLLWLHPVAERGSGREGGGGGGGVNKNVISSSAGN
jgi:hypothetical protein